MSHLAPPAHVHVLFNNGQLTLPAYDRKHPVGRLTSTPHENLSEYAGRLCYASLHKERGRPSAEYHKHILETQHNSVYAHHVFTFEIRGTAVAMSSLAALCGRPGVWVTRISRDHIRFAVSLRAVLEWEQHGVCDDSDPYASEISAEMVQTIRIKLITLFPNIINPGPLVSTSHFYDVDAFLEDSAATTEMLVRVEPETDQEKWATFLLTGVSRDLLQELVRHHYQCNPSVRSTRYVNEGPYDVSDPTAECGHMVPHPALGDISRMEAEAAFLSAQEMNRTIYSRLTSNGVPPKTARGAARSILPGCLETKIVWSTSLFQLKHTLKLRLDQGTGSVDPEIQNLAGLLRDAARSIGWEV